MLARILALTVLVCSLVYSDGAIAQSQSAEATAQKAPALSPWKNESELSVVLVSGNTDSQSTSLKQKTSYTFDQNTLVARGRYLATETGSSTTARAWEANGRYERALSTYWSAYTSYGAESDFFAGYVQRDNFDLGGKYFIVKRANRELITEAGYRYTHTYAIPSQDKYENFGRLFAQWSQKISANADVKFWAEYLPNFTNSDAYLINAEQSVSVSISRIFSVKMSYLMKYQGVVPPGFAEHLDTTYSTALVASW